MNDINDIVETLLKSQDSKWVDDADLMKAKVVTRNGVAFYADGKHAGKKVGTVRGKGGAKKESSPSSNPQAAEAAALSDADVKSYLQTSKILKDSKSPLFDRDTYNALVGEHNKRFDTNLRQKSDKPSKPRGSKYLNTFFKEKDLPNQSWELQGADGQTHFIDTDFVVESITGGTAKQVFGDDAVRSMENTIREIDFKNGDVNHFLKYIAQGIVDNY